MHEFELQLKSIWRKIPHNSKLAFASAFLGGLLIHLYIFTNNQLINHDSLYNFYSLQDLYHWGRPFLTYACRASSYLDLHWIIGLFSLLYLALSCGFLVPIFEIRSGLVSVITSLFIVSFPSLASLFSYMYTADGYCLAMLCAVLAVYLMIHYDNSVKILPAAILLLTFSLGCYQAYISTALVILLLWYLYKILMGSFYTGKKLYLHLIKSALVILISALLYYISFNVVLKMHNDVITQDQGMSEYGTAFSNLHDILAIMKHCTLEAAALLTDSSNKIHIPLWNYCTYGFTIFFCVYFFFKNKVYRNIIHLLLTVFICTLIPSAGFIYYFITYNVNYHLLMLGSFAFLIVFALLLADKFPFSGRFGLSACSLLLISYCAITIHYAIDDNIAYLALTQSYEKSYAFATRIADRIEHLEGFRSGDTIKLAVIGKLDNAPYHDRDIDNSIPFMTGIESGLVYFQPYHYVAFLNQYLGLNCIEASPEELEQILSSDEYDYMDAWPSRNSVKMIDDIIVIRFENN